MAQARHYASSAFPTTLASALGATGNPSVSSITGLPSQYPFTVLIDWGLVTQEAISVTSAPTGSGPYTLPCTRGIDGPAAQSHVSGAIAVHGVTAQDFNQWSSFIDSLTGTAAENFPQVFSPLAYGAKCDGTTDDTTAVAAAYAAAAGQTVLFPPGTVTCIQGNIDPAGATTWGPGATVRYLAGITTTHPMFIPSAGCSFRGLTFDLNSANTTNPASDSAGSAVYAFASGGWTDPVRLGDCKIINGYQAGVRFSTASVTNPTSLPSSPFIVDGCEISGCKYGVYIVDAADGVVSDCTIRSCSADGIIEVIGLRNRITGNSCVSNTTHGIVTEYSYGTLITGNNCGSNGTSGIVVGGGNTGLSAATHFTITGNSCRNNGHTTPGHGIDIDTTLTGSPTTPVPAYGTITGNTCDSNVDHGIYVNNSQYVTITGNTSSSNGLYGIQLTTQNATVTGNICTGNTDGIVVDNLGGHEITGNYSSGNTTSNYVDVGSIPSTYSAGGAQSPGGTSTFLRADGTWAGISAGAVEGVFTAAGQLLAGTGSGTGKLLTAGGSGQVLTVGGADPSGLEWSAAGTPGVPYSTSATGAPTAGTWSTGQPYIDSAGIAWTCVSGGTPGTWARASGLLATHQYAPGTLGHYTSTSATLAAMDTTNMTVSFSAPASGNVLVRLSAGASSSATSGAVYWGLLDHTSGNLYGNLLEADGATTIQACSVSQVITGFTAGTAYQIDWAMASSSGSITASTYAEGITSKTATFGNVSPAVMEVWAA